MSKATGEHAICHGCGEIVDVMIEQSKAPRKYWRCRCGCVQLRTTHGQAVVERQIQAYAAKFGGGGGDDDGDPMPIAATAAADIEQARERRKAPPATALKKLLNAGFKL